MFFGHKDTIFLYDAPPTLYKTLAAHGLEEHDVRITLIFSRIISFMSFTVLLSHNIRLIE
jgi:hypothetical protein